MPSEYNAALDMTREDLERLLDIQEKNRLLSILSGGFCSEKDAKKIKQTIRKIEAAGSPKTEIGITKDEISALKAAGLWQMSQKQ